MTDTTQNSTVPFANYPDVVTVSQMCAMLGIGKNKAYELLGNEIKDVRVGRKHLIPKKRVIEFLLGQS